MDLHYLEYIKEIAEQQNISRASESLHVSQPTLSIYLNKLETELGQPLFIRSRNRMSLTPAGTLYYHTCCEILNLRNKLYAELQVLNRPQIRIGVTNANIPHVQQVIGTFQKTHPDIDLMPTIVISKDINAMLLGDQLDFAVTGANLDPQAKNNPNICYEAIGEYEVMLTTSSQNPVLRDVPTDQDLSSDLLEALTDCPFILQDFGKNKRQFDMDMLDRLHIRPKKMLTLNSIQFIQQALIENYAFTLSPASYFIDPRIRQYPIPVKSYTRRVLKYSLKKKLTDADRDFISLLKEHFANNPYYYYLT